MSNSALASCVMLSPNHSGQRSQDIEKITVHHMAGNLSVETCGQVFAPSSRQASATYGVGTDGRVGRYLDESQHPWTSGSWWNDSRAVTIEVANSSTGGDWPVSSEAWGSLVRLCADICRRNQGIVRSDGKRGLEYTGDRYGSLTEHRMFAATACPGPYLHEWMAALAQEVNDMLDEGWVKDSKGWWYRNADGTWPSEDWKKVNGDWFYFGRDGYMLESRWLRYNDRWCWLKAGGYAACSEVVNVGGDLYAFDSDCYMYEGSVPLSDSGAMIL